MLDPCRFLSPYRFQLLLSLLLALLAGCGNRRDEPKRDAAPVDTTLPIAPGLRDPVPVTSTLQNGFKFGLEGGIDAVPALLGFYDSAFGARGMGIDEPTHVARLDRPGPGLLEHREWTIARQRIKFLFDIDRLPDGAIKVTLLRDVPTSLEATLQEAHEIIAEDSTNAFMFARVDLWTGKGKQARLVVDLFTDDPVHRFTSVVRWENGAIQYLGRDGKLVEARNPAEATRWGDSLEAALAARAGEDVPFQQRNGFTSSGRGKVVCIRKGDRWERFQGLRGVAVILDGADPTTAEFLRSHPEEIHDVDSAGELTERLVEAVAPGL